MTSIVNTLQTAVFKATGEQFDKEEIDQYLLMALEEFSYWDKGLSAHDFRKWLKFKILQYACCAISINTKENKTLFDKKAKYYRNKTSRFFTRG